jgi:purine-nucleoside phosphorylase
MKKSLNMIEQINEAVNYLKSNGVDRPEIGIILGTGLGGLGNKIQAIKIFDYENIPHFPISTVEFHKGKLIFGILNGKKVLAMQGRFHYYEGYSMQQITFPVRVMKFLGIKNLLISNAGGAMNPDYIKGNLMVIEDHINLLPENPLRGPEINEFGPRFTDMSQPYSQNLNDKILEIAERLGIKINLGIYVAVQGPNLETRAEYRYLRGIGADVVGMSTVPEVIVANQMNLPCCAISVLTDECDPDNLKPVNIQEIIELAGKAEIVLTKIFTELVGLL